MDAVPPGECQQAIELLMDYLRVGVRLPPMRGEPERGGPLDPSLDVDTRNGRQQVVLVRRAVNLEPAHEPGGRRVLGEFRPDNARRRRQIATRLLDEQETTSGLQGVKQTLGNE